MKSSTNNVCALRAIAAMSAAALIAAMLVLTGCGGSGAGAPAGGAVPKGPFDGIQAGGTVTFGTYEQDNDTNTKDEPIEWRVLDVQDGKALLVSVKALDANYYTSKASQARKQKAGERPNAWETCDLKNWLEATFAPTAFSEQERQRVAEVTCLTVEQAEQLFADDDDRLCAPTPYAVYQGCQQFGVAKVDGEKACLWWLSSAPTGWTTDGLAGTVGVYGDVHLVGNSVTDAKTGVRPAIWVTL